MQNLRTIYAATLATMAMVGLSATAEAASVTAEFAFNDGNSSAIISSSAGRSNLISTNVAGELDAYSFWVDADSFAFNSPRSLRFRMDLRRDDPGGVLYETSLATTEFTQSDFDGLQARTIASGGTFLQFTWDLSSFGIDVNAGEDLAVRFTSNPAVGLLVNDQRVDGAVPQPSTQNFGLSSFVTTIQTADQSLIYQLSVNESAVAPVPLPATLPGMIATMLGLATIGWRKRRKNAPA